MALLKRCLIPFTGRFLKLVITFLKKTSKTSEIQNVASNIRHKDFRPSSSFSVRLRGPPPPLGSETGCTGGPWPNGGLLILEK